MSAHVDKLEKSTTGTAGQVDSCLTVRREDRSLAQELDRHLGGGHIVVYEEMYISFHIITIMAINQLFTHVFLMPHLWTLRHQSYLLLSHISLVHAHTE